MVYVKTAATGRDGSSAHLEPTALTVVTAGRHLLAPLHLFLAPTPAVTPGMMTVMMGAPAPSMQCASWAATALTVVAVCPLLLSHPCGHPVGRRHLLPQSATWKSCPARSGAFPLVSASERLGGSAAAITKESCAPLAPVTHSPLAPVTHSPLAPLAHSLPVANSSCTMDLTNGPPHGHAGRCR